MTNVTDIELRLYEVLFAGRHQIKVASLIARAFQGEEIPEDSVINAALDRLICRNDIEFFGQSHHRWRHSEIKRVATSISG